MGLARASKYDYVQLSDVDFKLRLLSVLMNLTNLTNKSSGHIEQFIDRFPFIITRDLFCLNILLDHSLITKVKRVLDHQLVLSLCYMKSVS